MPRDDLPLPEYALIGDGVTAALVARDGSIDWLCQDRFDGPAVFCRLLDRARGGYFQITPPGGCRVQRAYAEDTNVLETEFSCAAGSVRLTDFMPLGSAEPIVLRRVEGLAGRLPLRVDFAPTFDFARAQTSIERTRDGCVARAADRQLWLSCPAPMTPSDRGLTASLGLGAGQVSWLVLTQGSTPPAPAAAEQALRSTLAAWRAWAARGNYAGSYEPLIRRSALVLKLLIHSPTGAMVAAPTTSLPEDRAGARNWDYRYAWLRDSSWLVSALMDLGYHDESMAFLAWLERLSIPQRGPAVLYDMDGRRPSREITLEQLRGYRGIGPVRIGNSAADQDQHDVFGEIAAAVHSCWEGMPSMRPLRPGLWQLVCALANGAVAHWSHADRGMWEVRDRPRHFVTSKLLCWVAVDRALSIARRDGLAGPVAQWAAARERMHEAISSQGLDPRTGTFRRSFDDVELDAGALLLPRYGLVAADDPRFGRTLERIRRELGASDLVRRYSGADGLAGSDNAFTACSFWLADAFARRGELDQARGVFEAAAGRANDLGLLSEEIDLQTGELLGNFPQTFTHLALIRAAITLARSAR